VSMIYRYNQQFIFQSCISVTFESASYFYSLKYIFGTTFYFLESRNFHTTSTCEKVEFFACTSTFVKVAKSSTFDNTVRGHFRSYNKDGGHTIRSAIVENPKLHNVHINFMALSYRTRVIANQSFTLQK